MTLFQRIKSLTRFGLCFVTISVGSILLILVLLLLIPWRATRIRVANRWGHGIGPIILWIAGIKANLPSREELDKDMPAIYVSNHSSELDPILALKLCPIGGCGISKKQIVRVPFFGQAYLLSGHLLIDRSSRKKAIASMQEIAALVKKHKLSIWIWPEGTRSADGKLLPFKKGFAHLALETKLPIVPIVNHGADKCFPARTIRLQPGTVDVEILPTVDTQHWQRDTIDDHIAEVREMYVKALAQSEDLAL